MRVDWTVRAQLDLFDIVDYIAIDDPDAARATHQEIIRQVATLTDHPRMGRTGRVRGTRELVINRTPYIATYRIYGQVLRIVTVRHGARLWPGAF